MEAFLLIYPVGLRRVGIGTVSHGGLVMSQTVGGCRACRAVPSAPLDERYSVMGDNLTGSAHRAAMNVPAQ